MEIFSARTSIRKGCAAHAAATIAVAHASDQASLSTAAEAVELPVWNAKNCGFAGKVCAGDGDIVAARPPSLEESDSLEALRRARNRARKRRLVSCKSNAAHTCKAIDLAM
jgi:hypothetical protein